MMGKPVLPTLLQTSYGPHGHDKVLYYPEEHRFIQTNDGYSILKAFEGSKDLSFEDSLYLEASKVQDLECGDGTTSVVLLAHALVQSFESDLYNEKVLEEFYKVTDLLVEYIEECIEIDLETFQDQVMESCMYSKVLSPTQRTHLTGIMSGLMQKKINRNNVSIIRIPGMSFMDSRLIHGVIFKRPFVFAGYEQQPKKILNPKILLIHEEIEFKKPQNVKLNLSMEDYLEFQRNEELNFQEALKRIDLTEANVIISSKSIGDYATQHWAESGKVCLSRVSKEDMSALQTSLNLQISSLSNPMTKSCRIYEEILYSNTPYCLFIAEPYCHSTIILHGSTSKFLKEAERVLHDAIGVAKSIQVSPYLIPGGGCVESKLRNYITSLLDETNCCIRSQVLECYQLAFDQLILLLLSNTNPQNSRNMFHTLLEKNQSNETWVLNPSNQSIEQQIIPQRRNKLSETKIDSLKVGKLPEFSTAILEPSLLKKTLLRVAVECATTILGLRFGLSQM